MKENEEIKVLHVGRDHTIFDTRIFRKECRTLAAAGYTVSYMTSDRVVAFDGKQDYVRLRTLSDVKNPYRVKQFLPYIRKGRDIKKRYLKEVLAEKPDIVHIHESGLGFLIKKLRKHHMLVIYDIHEDNVGSAGTYFKKYGAFVSHSIAFLTKYKERRFVRAADGVITATDHIAELLMPGLKQKKWEVVYNYPILEDCALMKQKDMDSDYLCYTGDMSESRGLDKTFEALAWLDKDIQIKMIGSISPEFRKKLERIYSKVEFCGYLSQEEIGEMHNGAFAGMCVLANTPNNYYGLPNKIFEYMRDGVPVILSDFPQWRSIIEKGHCGIVCAPEDIEAIARAIDYFFTHQDVARKMGKNGKECVMEDYNWKKEGEKLISFYHKIAKGRNLV